MFLSTTSVRKLANTFNTQTRKHTYTDKTSKKDTTRRSVVFCVFDAQEADKLYIGLSTLMQEGGFENTVKRTTSDCNLQRHVLGGEYVRVIATLEK